MGPLSDNELRVPNGTASSAAEKPNGLIMQLLLIIWTVGVASASGGGAGGGGSLPHGRCIIQEIIHLKVAKQSTLYRHLHTMEIIAGEAQN